MNNVPLSDTPTVGLGRFIKEARFSVPSHQRDYSWTSDHVSKFLDDIEESYNKNVGSYFCGLMVFTQGTPSLLNVLDGQQRLATTLMIFSAIRTRLSQYPEYKKQESLIEAFYLENQEIGAAESQPKLSLAPANNDVFQRYVTKLVPVDDIVRGLRAYPPEDRNLPLLRAILQVHRYIRDRAEKFQTANNANDHFIKLTSFIHDHCRIVRFVADGDDAAYTIFETLNDRGLELAPLDLVKNYIFSKAERHRVGGLRDAEQRWSDMMTLLGSTRADSFLRAFYTSRHAKVDGARLYSNFKRQYDTPEKLYEISIEMRSDAENYNALFQPDDAIWSPYSAKARRSIEALKIVGASQLHPVILAALRHFDRHEMERLLWLLEVIAVRYQLVRRGRPGRIESLGARAARDITDQKLATASGVRQALSELYTPDADFESQFAIKTERESKKARYLLAGIERQSILREGKNLANELKPDETTLEHVFPRSPGDAWGKVIDNDPEFTGELILRLGNMCLLTEVNRALGNKLFPEKKKIFAKSRLRTTVTLADYSDWGRAEIERRQKYMAKLAVSEWRFE
jgi:uncharacterized protein with ParB-like and HNH nuclease domain